MENDRFEQDIAKLKLVYDIFDDQVCRLSFVCKEKCAACCTCNVTMTSLEARLIYQTLSVQRKNALKKRIDENFPEKRFVPKATTNQFARSCMEGVDLPDEENNPDWGRCPLLKDDLCTIYEVRPFGCRALVSEVNCKKTGAAQLPSLMLTINTVFQQFIEQLDHHGLFGNLADMLFAVSHSKSQLFDSIPSTLKLIKNEPVPIWMVPPEHQKRAQHILSQLQKGIF
jgi:Fe-S-cluster containining protein